jgi:hypothetical protein
VATTRDAPSHRVTRPRPSPRRLARLHVWILIAYFFLGTASQKLLPSEHEIFPLFGWSLFSQVPGPITTYRIMIREFDGDPIDPPVPLIEAPQEMVGGDRFIARKVIQRLGAAQDAGEVRKVERLRKLLEQSYLRARASYVLTVESYQPLERWRGIERPPTVLGTYSSIRAKEPR